MIIEYIERLRKEPKEVRVRAVYFWTSIIVGLIVVSYLGLRITITNGTEETQINTLAAPYEAQAGD